MGCPSPSWTTPVLGAVNLHAGLQAKTIEAYEAGGIVLIVGVGWVRLHGGHITSFKTAGNVELLYLRHPYPLPFPSLPALLVLLISSKSADITENSSIRGGIPICWPQFGGLGDLPSHGLLRRSNEWFV